MIPLKDYIIQPTETKDIEGKYKKKTNQKISQNVKINS